ncbi:MBOAT family protein [bacterium]|nr:MBOAT family protein [bacterium]
MLFSSPLFLFIFLPIAMLMVWLPNGRWRLFGLLGASILFYLWSEPRFFWVALASSYLDFWVTARMHRALMEKRTQTARRLVGLGILSNVALLLYYKYLLFFSDGFNRLLQLVGNDWRIPAFHIALPIAISFIVFEKITYLVDVYRGKSLPETRFHLYLTYVLLFPKLLAGPIIKYHEIEPQLHAPRGGSRTQDVVTGFKRFTLGLIKKLLLADALAGMVDQIFAMPADHVGASLAWLAVVGFALQIYLDFSSYSDMAIGLARMYGFRLRENFNYPYISRNFTEFWRRWHISLSTWIREYLYIPLGGNRHGDTRMYANLCICFTLSGLWHGANWTFLAWGIFHGLFLVLDKLGWVRISQKFPSFVNIAITFLFICIGWALFRAQTIDQAGMMIGRMFTFSSPSAPLVMGAYIWSALVISLAMAFVPAFPAYWRMKRNRRYLAFLRSIAPWLLCVLGFIAIGKAVTATSIPFLYFRF